MQISLDAIAKEVGASTERFGCTVELDSKTDNLIVMLGDHGFVITRRYIEDHAIAKVIEEAAGAVADLAAGKDQSGDGEFPVKFYSRQELADQADQRGWR